MFCVRLGGAKKVENGGVDTAGVWVGEWTQQGCGWGSGHSRGVGGRVDTAGGVGGGVDIAGVWVGRT